MSVDVTRSSRLSIGELKSIDGIEFWDVLDLPVYRSNPNDFQHLLVEGDRLDLLADLYYQDPFLDWVIKWANNIDISPMDLTVGGFIVIPDPIYVKTNILNGQLT